MVPCAASQCDVRPYTFVDLFRMFGNNGRQGTSGARKDDRCLELKATTKNLFAIGLQFVKKKKK